VSVSVSVWVAAQQEAARVAAEQAAAQEAAQREAARQAEMQRAAAAQAAAAQRQLAQQEAERKAALEAARQREQQQATRPEEKAPELPAEKPRRRTLIGRPDQDARLAVFAESWSQRVQQNADFEFLDAAKSGDYTNPIVTVTLRADGSVDSVVFRRASGIAAIDDAIRIIIASLAPYSRIPAELAMDYDVVEVTRLWTFGSGLRLARTGR
jgi:hypothetical protein